MEISGGLKNVIKNCGWQIQSYQNWIGKEMKQRIRGRSLVKSTGTYWGAWRSLQTWPINFYGDLESFGINCLVPLSVRLSSLHALHDKYKSRKLESNLNLNWEQGSSSKDHWLDDFKLFFMLNILISTATSPSGILDEFSNCNAKVAYCQSFQLKEKVVGPSPCKNWHIFSFQRENCHLFCKRFH